MPEEKENHGVIHEGIIPGSVMVGGVGDLPVIMPSGDWEPYLAKFERQSRDPDPEHEPIDVMLESMNCCQFSLLNVLETLARLLGVTLNFSDRFLYWASGCSAQGNTFSNAFLGLLRRGVPKEELWPWIVAMSRATYGMEPPDDIKAEALKIFDDWQLGNLRYVTPTVAAMKVALTKGPIWFCNDIHAMMIYRIDDRIRVLDTYPGPKGDGKGSFALWYVSEIVAAYNVPFTPKKPVTQPPMPTPTLKLPDNCFVTGVFEHEQKVALHLGGKLLMGDPAAPGATPEQVEIAELRSYMLVDSQWKARNENPVTHDFEKGPMRSITEKDWNSFPHVNFKGEPLA